MYVTTEITIDFQRPRQNTIQVVQDDTTRKIRLILKNGGNDYDITADLESEETWVGAVAYLKSDGHGGVYDTTEAGDAAVQLVSGTTNQFDVLLVGQVFTAAGWTQVNIKFYNADFSKVLSTFAIDVNVQRNAASDYESEDYSNMQSLGAIRAEMVAFEASVRAELLAMKANGEQDVTDAYIAAAQETPGLTYEQFFMTLPNGCYRIVINAPAYIYKAEVVTVDEGQYCKVDVFDHDGYCETTIYTNGTAVFNYVDGSTTGRIITMPVQVPTPVNPTDAANRAFVVANGLSETAKQALLNCFAHVAWIDEHGQDYYDELETALMQKTLESITAVFVQGDTVIYDTDSLDDLKPMLTVTAHYDDGTSATVTAYTMSGTLTVGTSTITVSYGGKTATFDVAVEYGVLAKIGFFIGSSASSANNKIYLGGYDNKRAIAYCIESFGDIPAIDIDSSKRAALVAAGWVDPKYAPPIPSGVTKISVQLQADLCCAVQVYKCENGIVTSISGGSWSDGGGVTDYDLSTFVASGATHFMLLFKNTGNTSLSGYTIDSSTVEILFD